MVDTDGQQDEITTEHIYTSGPFTGLTPNVIRLGIVSFFADVSSEMLYPLNPIFITMVLGAPVALLGLIEGVAEATASLLKTFSGRLSDLSGRRRPYVLAGYSLSAVAKPLMAFAYAWPFALFARVIDRFGKGLRTSPRDALLADSVPEYSRGKAFGWHRAMDTMGAVLGPLLALLLIFYLGTGDHLRTVYKLAFIPGIIGAACVLFVKEHRRVISTQRPPSIRFGALPAPFRYYLIAWGAFAITNSSDAFLILRAQQVIQRTVLAGWLSTALVIVLYTVYNLVYAGASPYLGHLSDRIGRKRVLLGGLVVFALVYLGFAFITAMWQIWVLFAIYGLYIAATDGVGKALAIDLVPANFRASGIGILATVSGVAALIASSVAGLLWTTFDAHFGTGYGPLAAFSYGAVGAIIGGALLLRVKTQPMQMHPAS